jgi:hypothetical protein
VNSTKILESWFRTSVTVTGQLLDSAVAPSVFGTTVIATTHAIANIPSFITIPHYFIVKLTLDVTPLVTVAALVCVVKPDFATVTL